MVLVLGCNQPERLGNSAPIDPRAASPRSVLETIPLEPHVLRRHANYDRWEDEVIARGGAALAYLLYKESLVEQRGDQRTFVRWMLLSHREELGDEYREPLYKFVEGLATGDDLSADVRYLLGFVAWQQLIGGDGEPEVPRNLQSTSMVDTVLRNWTALVDEHPDWEGPRGLTTSTVRRKLATLRGTLEAALTVADPKRPEGPTLGGWLADASAGVYTERGAEPPWAGKATIQAEELADFHTVYEDKGPKKGCERLDAAVKALGDLAPLGDAYAHCALDRRNPWTAIDQVRRMTRSRVAGGIPAVVERLRTLGRADDALASEVADLVVELRASARAAPRWAERSGLGAWLARTP